MKNASSFFISTLQDLSNGVKKLDLDNISHLNIFVPNIQVNVGSNSQSEMTTLECWDPFYHTFENVFESQNILQPTRPTYLTTYIQHTYLLIYNIFAYLRTNYLHTYLHVARMIMMSTLGVERGERHLHAN